MAAHAELVISPKVDQAQTKATVIKMETALENGAKQARVDKILEDDIEKGSKAGSSSLSSSLRLAAGAVAAALGAALVASIDEATNDARDVMDDLLNKAEEIKDSMQSAQALGIDTANYAAIEIAGQALGQDKGDIRGLFSGFVGALSNDEMSQYKDLADTSGLETAFFTFLQQASNLSQGERNIRLNETFGDEDAIKAAVWVDKINELAQSGEATNTANLIEAILGVPVDFERLRQGQAVTKDSSTVINQELATQQLELQYKGITRPEAEATVDLMQSDKEVQQARRDTYELRVQRAIFENEVTMGKITVGEISAGVINETYDAISDAANDRVEDIKKATQMVIDDPSEENLSNLASETLKAGFIGYSVEQAIKNTDWFKSMDTSFHGFFDKLNTAIGAPTYSELQRTANQDRTQSAQSTNQYEDK